MFEKESRCHHTQMLHSAKLACRFSMRQHYRRFENLLWSRWYRQVRTILRAHY